MRQNSLTRAWGDGPGERPLAFLVVKEGTHVIAEELRSLLAPHDPKGWIPDGFRFVPTLPKTSTGRVSKPTLRESLSGPPQGGPVS